MLMRLRPRLRQVVVPIDLGGRPFLKLVFRSSWISWVFFKLLT